ncbi:MAG TPA: outer membrane lipoprotein carrier protein LolA [Thermoanaerobaculia bacterium]|nr:outer membrane lipoprotein carrier protein LolA [Thermoanaerobaculia bacterium]
MRPRTHRFALVTLVAAQAAVTALALITAEPAAALHRPAPPDPMAPGLSGADRLKALLDRVKLQQKDVRTIEARFVQHRVSAMLVAPEDSSGTFSYAAPDRVRWEYQAPTPITVVITGSEMTTWYRDLKRAERLKIGRYSSQVFKFLGASGSMDTLLEYFTVELTLPKEKGDPYRLKLLPRYERIKKRIRSMRVDIDSERFFPNHLEYQEADGDVTSYDFKDFLWNPTLPADRFALQLPSGVETRVVDLAKDAKPQSRP